MLYLHQDLVKGDSTDSSSGEDQTGEQRGGDYAARVQTGYEKDGSPRYRYFKTAEEHREYLQGQGKKESGKEARGGKQHDDHLKRKLKKEQSESSKKTKQGHGKVSLFVRDKASRTAKKEADKKVKKSFDLFVWSLD